MLILRPSQITDIPPLYRLASDKKHLFLDDYSDFDLEYAHGVCNGSALVIDHYDYAVGAIWFDDQRDDLHCQLHALVQPQHWREVLKQDMLGKAVDWAFENLGVAKILAEPMSTQKSAIRLLRKYRFMEHRPWYKHTKQNGIVVDVIRFEARKNFWRRHRDGNGQ